MISQYDANQNDITLTYTELWNFFEWCSERGRGVIKAPIVLRQAQYRHFGRLSTGKSAPAAGI